MNFTFGIITDGTVSDRVSHMIETIHAQDIPEYQIIVVGGDNRFADVHHIPFTDIRGEPGNICAKKNLITKNAKHNNIVYIHDYVEFLDQWYSGYLKFNQENPDWDIAMNKILDINGNRFRDFCYWDKPGVGQSWICRENWCGSDGIQFNGQWAFAPYDATDSEYMFVSGTYWVAKKHVMEAEPLNENIRHCAGEDVEWSIRVRNKYKYRMNQHSTVKLLKNK